MKFTSLQLGFLAKHFSQFAEEVLTIEQWANIADIVKEFLDWVTLTIKSWL